MLSVRDLRHRFGDVIALDGVSFEASAGEIVGLVGRNGAGKTTTMRAIMGILTADAGANTWSEHPVAQPDRLRFGYMPEERGLYPQMGLLDQVTYFARLHGVEREAAAAQARRWLERLGLDQRAEDRLVALSHGNQQRVQLAVALVHSPDLLVLDEPFAGLDPEAVDSLSAVLSERASDGAAILFSSHQLELVERICRRVVVMEGGRVIAAGSLDDLRRDVPAQLRVKVRAPAKWAAGLPGVAMVREDEEGLLLVVEPGTDTQAILRAALAAGPVDHFGFESAGLLELYRQMVAR